MASNVVTAIRVIQIFRQPGGRPDIYSLLCQWANGRANSVMLSSDFHNNQNITFQSALKSAVAIMNSTNNAWVELIGQSYLTKTEIKLLTPLFYKTFQNDYIDSDKHCTINALSFILKLPKNKNQRIKNFINKNFNANSRIICYT